MIKAPKRDQELVSAFLLEYRKISGSVFEVKEWVDDRERTKPAVEAIAVETTTGECLAIEHTLLQPFVGEKDDTQRFLMVIGELEKDASLKLPRYEVRIGVRVGAIPKGIKWTDVNETLRKWIRDSISTCHDGESTHEVRHGDLKVEILVSKMALEHHETGLMLFGRYDMPDSLIDVIRTAFKKKLPKLIGTDTEKHILLFEKNIPVYGNTTVYEMIKSVSADFPDLKKVDEIWLIETSWWESDNYLSFGKVWPEIKTWVNGQLQ